MRWLPLAALTLTTLKFLVAPTLAAADPAPVPTLSEVWSTILQPSCSECHFNDSGLGFQADTKLNAYQTLVNQPALFCDNEIRVIPGNAAASHLIRKLEGTMSCGDRMPLGDLPFDQATIDLIRAWIDDGARYEAPVPGQPSTWSTIKALYR